VADLKEATAARRRVEDALRNSEDQLRALVDCSPAGLCLLRSDGAPVAGNGPFARMLGYESPADLLSVSLVLGLFGSEAEQCRILALCQQQEGRIGDALLRRKDGGPHAAWVMGAVCRSSDAIALVVLEPQSLPDLRGTLSDAWSAGTPGE
jgi:PAS domain-containing protein